MLETPEKEKSWKQRKISLVIVIMCTIYIIQDIFTNKYLFRYSNNTATIDFQKFDGEWLKVIMEIASNGSLVLIGISVFWMLLTYQNRARFMSFGFFFSMAVYSMSLLKQIYHQPRPYMQNPDIECMECAPEWGNPSGHSFLNCLYFLAWPWLYHRDLFELYQNHAIQWKRIWSILLLLAWIILIGLSRVYLGVHSLNQIFLGFVYGFLFLTLYVSFLVDHLDDFFINVCSYSDQMRKRYLVYVAGLAAVILVLNNVLLEVLKHQYNPSKTPLEAEAASNCCGENYIFSYLYNKCFVDSGIFSLGIGLMLMPLLFPLQYSHLQFEQSYKKLSLVDKLKRAAIILLLLGAVGAAFGGPFLLGKSNWINYPTAQVYLAYYIGFVLNLQIISFSYVYLLPKIFNKFKLRTQGDWLEIPTQFPSEGEQILDHQIENHQDSLIQQDQDLNQDLPKAIHILNQSIN